MNYKNREWKPRDYQKEVLEADLNGNIKTIVMSWKRRSGKDEVAMRAMRRAALEKKGNYFYMYPARIKPRVALWDMVNPETGQTRWQDVFTPDIVAHVDDKRMKVTLINGSTCQLTNETILLGIKPTGVVFSEASEMDDYTYRQAVYNVTYSNGWAIHTATPNSVSFFNTVSKAAEEDLNAVVSFVY